MKEKTFEELIIHIIDDEGNISATDVLKLLQQVREATIAECLEIATKGYYWASTSKKIENLPADRIKIEPVQ